MGEQEELRDLLGRLPPTARVYLRQYFQSPREGRTERREELERLGKPGWAELLVDVGDDSEAEAVFVSALDEVERTSPTRIREIRILADYKGRLLRVCKLLFNRNDFSAYLVPSAAEGRYFYGARPFAEREIEQTFDFTAQLSSASVPKLSIHESGQVHVRTDVDLAGPLHIPALSTLRGQHVASLSVDAFEGLPPFDGAPRTSPTAVDHVIKVEAGVESGRLAVYMNGEEQVFDYRCGIVVTLTRPRRPRPLFVGISPIAQLPVGGAGRGGVTVIGGWVPDRPPEEANDFLYLRGA